MDSSAIRHNYGKAPIHLIPPAILLRLAEVYAYGARKYALLYGLSLKDFGKIPAQHATG